ncbi:MAG: hypothetical protein MK066_08575 [Crocinitomicaceae bacterium]|nr:hypothetical protein [Crocinitomicaceae bacterium]
MRNRKKQNYRLRLTLAILILLSVGSAMTVHFLSKRNYYKTQLMKLPAGFSSHGIDVSHYQGNIDWSELIETMDSSISFAYIKATEGTRYIDPLYKQNYNRCRSMKLPIGIYHFFSPMQNALKQADHFLNNYAVESNDLPPVLDAETEGRNNAELIKKMKVWLTQVEKKTKKRPIIYTSFHFYSTKFKGKFDEYQFWIANYGNHANRMKDDQIVIWQYSDEGRLPGINGNVDLNVSKNSFLNPNSL